MVGITGDVSEGDGDRKDSLPELCECESIDEGEEITDCSNAEYIDSNWVKFLR